MGMDFAAASVSASDFGFRNCATGSESISKKLAGPFPLFVVSQASPSFSFLNESEKVPLMWNVPGVARDALICAGDGDSWLRSTMNGSPNVLWPRGNVISHV